MKKYTVEFSTEAEQDLSEAYVWYEKRSPELAKRFASEAITAIDSLYFLPNRFQVRFDQYRAVSIENFPYLIFYRIMDDSVQIARIWHMKRDYKNF